MRNEPFLSVWYSVCPSVHLSVRLFASLLYFLHHLTNNRTKKATNMEKVKYHSDMGQEKKFFSLNFFCEWVCIVVFKTYEKGRNFRGQGVKNVPFEKQKWDFFHTITLLALLKLGQVILPMKLSMHEVKRGVEVKKEKKVKICSTTHLLEILFFRMSFFWTQSFHLLYSRGSMYQI